MGSLRLPAGAFVVVLAALGSSGCGILDSLIGSAVAANEAGALGTVRVMLSGQIAYAVNNGNAYGSVGCLESPSPCVPKDPGVPYLTPGTTTGERAGYIFEFHPGPDAPNAAGRPPGSALASFVYVAKPVRPGTTGNRTFCVDATFNICTLPDGVSVAGPQCPAACQILK
jgi:hypothetical protein